MNMLWPVYGHDPHETLAMFFDWGSAADFAMHPELWGAERRNLYIGEPRPPRSGPGYRGADIADAMDTIVDRQLQRHSQIIKDAETIKKESGNARE